MTIIDAHAHLGAWNLPIKDTSPDKFLSQMRQYKISKSIVSSVSAIAYDFEEGNGQLAETLNRHDNLYGYVAVNANYLERSKNQLDLHFSSSKFVGVKIHASLSNQPVSSTESIELLSLIASYKRPTLIHGAFPDILAAARKFPDLVIISAHMGFAGWRKVIDKAKEVSNIYFDFCFSQPHLAKIETAISVLGAERILFGTDNNLLDPALTFGMMEETGMTDEQRDLIYHRNAARLFNI